ncbi:MAG: DMT family transporter [Chloroflexota bacterium]|nr:DMT family transporter [Chloroflexota bacterium]
MKSKTIQSNVMLFLAAIIWGGGFVAQRLGMEEMPPFFYNGIRFTLGSLALLPLLWWQRKKNDPYDASIKDTALMGGVAGILIFLGATFQQVGLVYTPAGKAGFITGLYVVIVPIYGAFTGERAPLQTWFGAILAVAGLYFLSVRGDFTFALGDGLVLAGSFFWAAHVHFIGKFAARIGAIRLSFLQFVITALLSFGVGLIVESLTWEMVQAAWWPIFYGGVISVGIAYTLQVVAQKNANPSHAAIILSLEAVFALLGGWLLLAESLTGRGILGCGLMLVGMFISQQKTNADNTD